MGTIALNGATSSTNLNFTGYTSLSLGSLGSSTYSGTLTPAGRTYHLGGGGGTLTFASAMTAGRA